MRTPNIAPALSFALALLGLFPSAQALEPVSGTFTAQEACPALQSMKTSSNPGNIQLAPGTPYQALGLNRPGGDKLQILVPTAHSSKQRWVPLSCGKLNSKKEQAASEKAPVKTQNTSVAKSSASKNNLLALNWQPSFCETLSRTSECKQLNDGRLPTAGRELTLHGLWPQPRAKEYCGVPDEIRELDKPRTWNRLPEPKLDRQTEKALRVAMPGTASHLEKHEWIKHGTCYHAAGGADEYYDDALLLLAAINNSSVGSFFRDNIGRKVSGKDIRSAFDQAFGTGTGERVQIKCVQDGRRTLINEIWISLYGDIAPSAKMTELLLNARRTRMDCERGILDRPGLQ